MSAERAVEAAEDDEIWEDLHEMLDHLRRMGVRQSSVLLAMGILMEAKHNEVSFLDQTARVMLARPTEDIEGAKIIADQVIQEIP